MIKKLINKYKKSKNAKTLAGNFMWLSILQVASYVFPLITYPYLARVIGVDGFGKIAFAAGIMMWIQTVADWGFNLTATRDVSVNRENQEKVSEIFSNVLWARVALMIFSFIILVILVLTIPVFRADADIIFITFLMIPGHICCPEWFFQALQRMKYITFINVGIKLFFTACVFLFIRNAGDYLYQPLLMSAGYLLSGVFAFYMILKKWHYKLHKPDIKASLQAIKKSTDVFINALLPNLYNSFGVVLLGFWGGSYYNGLYDAGHRCVAICNNMVNIFSRTFFPFLSRNPEKHGTYVKISLGFSLSVAIILFIIAPYVINILFDPSFSKAVIVLRIQCLVIVFYSLSDVFGKNFLIIHHKERKLRNFTLIASIIGFCSAFPLVYFLKDVGVAINVTLSLGIIALLTSTYGIKLKKTLKTK